MKSWHFNHGWGGRILEVVWYIYMHIIVELVPNETFSENPPLIRWCNLSLSQTFSFLDTCVAYSTNGFLRLSNLSLLAQCFQVSQTFFTFYFVSILQIVVGEIGCVHFSHFRDSPSFNSLCGMSSVQNTFLIKARYMLYKVLFTPCLHFRLNYLTLF